MIKGGEEPRKVRSRKIEESEARGRRGSKRSEVNVSTSTG